MLGCQRKYLSELCQAHFSGFNCRLFFAQTGRYTSVCGLKFHRHEKSMKLYRCACKQDERSVAGKMPHFFYVAVKETLVSNGCREMYYAVVQHTRTVEACLAWIWWSRVPVYDATTVFVYKPVKHTSFWRLFLVHRRTSLSPRRIIKRSRICHACLCVCLCVARHVSGIPFNLDVVISGAIERLHFRDVSAAFHSHYSNSKF